MMFLVLAIKKAKNELSGIEDVFNWLKLAREWRQSKNLPFLCYIGIILLLFYVIPWEWGIFLSFLLFLLAIPLFHFWRKPDSYVFYTLLAGMALGFYLLIWIGGELFVYIIFAYGVLQCIIDGVQGRPTDADYICIVLSSIFFVPLLMILPFFNSSFPYYQLSDVGSLGVGVIAFSLPLLYRYLTTFGYKHSLINEGIKAKNTTEKTLKNEYICPLCGKKSKSAGIVDHMKTKHRGAIERSNTREIKQFLEINPELSAGLKKLGMPLYDSSPLERISKYNSLFPFFTAVIFLVLCFAFFPTIISFYGILTPSGTGLTIAEVHPMDSTYAWLWFTTPFFISLFTMVILALDVAIKDRPEELLLLVWSIIMFVAVGGLGVFGIEGIGQNRFAYYYAVNAAILTGLFSVRAFEILTGAPEKAVRGEPVAGVRSGKKGGKARRSDSTLNVQLIAFSFAILTVAIVGLVQVGIRSLIPLIAIVIIFFIWMHAASKKSLNIEKPLTKTLAIVFIMVIVFYPFPLNALAKPFPSTSNLPLSAAFAINTAERGIGADEDWYEALRWMRNNTPDPGVDYYGLYAEPAREDYEYPPSAYGVMSWWDYGHMITWIAHRIPNANPFQQGIGGPIGSDNPGACVFFIVDTENEANDVADTLGVRYVVSDFMMADVWNALYNKYAAMTVWAGDQQYYNTLAYYYRTMEARLHMFDGADADVDGESISALAHYRVVHESPTFILPMLIMDENTGYMYWRHFSGDYQTTATQVQILHGLVFSVNAGAWIEDDLNNKVMPEIFKSAFTSTNISLSEEITVTKVDDDRWTISDEVNENVFIVKKAEGMLHVYIYGVKTGQPGIKAWTPEYIEPVSFVKVFEYVKGAKIEGNAPNISSLIEVSTDVTTNQERTFTYSARTTANDSYGIIVPYSTEGPIEGGTNFDVFANPYKLRAGHFENETVIWDVEKEVNVTERAVTEGETITVDLLSE
jgi:asparagine N-glycosylation enzyme membrane subunit Stt3